MRTEVGRCPHGFGTLEGCCPLAVGCHRYQRAVVAQSTPAAAGLSVMEVAVEDALAHLNLWVSDSPEASNADDLVVHVVVDPSS